MKLSIAFPDLDNINDSDSAPQSGKAIDNFTPSSYWAAAWDVCSKIKVTNKNEIV